MINRVQQSQSVRLFLLLTALSLLHIASAEAEQQVRLKSGLTEQGLIADIATINKNPFAAAAAGAARPIMYINDGLRRVYIHRNGMVAAGPDDVRGVDSLFEFPHRVALDGKVVAGVGAVLGVTPFDQFGRRLINIRGPEGGTLTVFQGITELNPRYARLQALKGDGVSYVWDMRVATSTITTNTLRSIFKRQVNQDDLDSRLKVVRFFMECERFADAHLELQQILQAFPAAKNMRAMLISITERQGDQLIKEAKRRVKVGQIDFARNVFTGFPLNAVGRLTRLEVQDAIAALDKTDSTAQALVAQLRQQIGQLNANQAGALGKIVDEIEAGLSAATLPRLNDYARLGAAKQLPLDNRVALAIAGWLMGANSNEQNLKVATGLILVRDLVAEYLGSDDPARREAILLQLQNLERAEPDYISRMLPLLTPVKPLPQGSKTGVGMHTIVPPEDPTRPITKVLPNYVVQLPPEYDPLRSYPCIVALHPPSGSPQQQVDWWSGPRDPQSGERMGQAARNGYIVVAPRWTRPQQRVFEYTPREHQRVLVSLRDAMRRTSIDSDRVFLVGHGEGASAAWDISLSHPDMWAGLISINGEPKKTITQYHPNALYLPLYFVMGELDGAPAPLFRNGPILDRYMKARNDAIVVMYRGRPREYFPEELPRMFDWMNVGTHVRRDIPQEIETVMMREGDTFFWWLELDQLKPGTALDPILWDQAGKYREKPVEANVNADNQIRIGQGPTDRFHVFLAPKMGIDLSKRVTVRYRNRRKDFDFDGNSRFLLEDTRQRADRKRPYWAQITIP